MIAFFLAALALTSLVDTAAPLPMPRLLGLEKDEDEAMREAAAFLDGSWAELVEHDLRVRSRVRRLLGQPYAVALFVRLGECKGELLAGREHTAFLAGRVAPPTRRSDDEIAGAAASTLAALERRLAGLGMSLVVVPIPRKSTVLASLLPPGVDARPELDARVVEALIRHGVAAPSLLEAWADEDPRDLYFGLGTHWTPRAEVLAAEATAEAGGFRIPPEQRRGTVELTGGTTSELGLLHVMGIEPETASELAGPFAAPSYDVFVDGRRSPPRAPDEVGRIALVGTSFSARRQFPMLLAHAAQEPVFNGAEPGVHPDAMLLELLREHADRLPEVLVFEAPLHLAARWPPYSELGQVFGEHPPPAWTVLEDLEPGAPFDDGAVLLTRGSRNRLVALLGRVHDAGDGVLCVRIAGEVSGGSVTLAMTTRSLRLDSTWNEEMEELVLPVLGTEPGSGGVLRIFVSARSRAPSLTVRELQLVVPVDPRPLASADPSTARTTTEGDAWTDAFELGDPEVPAQGVLWIELDEAAAGGSLLTVEATAASGRSVGSGAVAPAVRTVLLDLDPLAGEMLDDVRVGGRGERRATRSVRMLAPAPPPEPGDETPDDR